jgi:hypothetical protein
MKAITSTDARLQKFTENPQNPFLRAKGIPDSPQSDTLRVGKGRISRTRTIPLAGNVVMSPGSSPPNQKWKRRSMPGTAEARPRTRSRRSNRSRLFVRCSQKFSNAWGFRMSSWRSESRRAWTQDAFRRHEIRPSARGTELCRVAKDVCIGT